MSTKMTRQEWEAAYAAASSIPELMQFLRALLTPKRGTPEKKTYGVPRDDGPMMYLGVQIVKRMEQIGWPSKIHCCYRSPKDQRAVYDKGHSKALPYQSAHQYNEAVDIVHSRLYWEAPPEYWEALAICVRNVAADFDVELNHGHHWKFVDSAHIELSDWKDFRLHVGRQVPTREQLAERFKQVLPRI